MIKKLKINYKIIILILTLISLYSLYFIYFNYRNIDSISLTSTSDAINNSNLNYIQTKIIWQTAPNNPRPQVLEYFEDWKNTKEWDYQFRSDAQVINYLKQKFSSLNIDSMMKEKPILGYDLFRYSIILENGGFYVDSDVQKLIGFETIMEKELRDCGAIIGIEVDYRTEKDWIGKFPRNFQFCQWTFYSRPRHPMLNLITQRVARQIEFHQQRNISLSSLDVMEVTGPGIWTDAILDYVLATQGKNLKDEVKCGEFYRIEDICILDVMGLASSMPHSTCKKEANNDTIMLSYHHFLGTWKEP